MSTFSYAVREFPQPSASPQRLGEARNRSANPLTWLRQHAAPGVTAPSPKESTSTAARRSTHHLQVFSVDLDPLLACKHLVTGRWAICASEKFLLTSSASSAPPVSLLSNGGLEIR